MSKLKITRAALITTAALMAASPALAQHSHGQYPQVSQKQSAQNIRVVKKTAGHNPGAQNNNASDLLAAAALIGLFAAVVSK